MELASGGLDANVYVRDIDLMLGFYREVLGLELEATHQLADGRALYWFTVGASRLKLVSPRADSVPPAAPGGRNAQSGIQVIVLRVLDVEAEMARIDRAIDGSRAVVVSRPTQFPSGAIGAMLEDPEGNTVELVQPPPGEPAR